ASLRSGRFFSTPGRLLCRSCRIDRHQARSDGPFGGTPSFREQKGTGERTRAIGFSSVSREAYLQATGGEEHAVRPRDRQDRHIGGDMVARFSALCVVVAGCAGSHREAQIDTLRMVRNAPGLFVGHSVEGDVVVAATHYDAMTGFATTDEHLGLKARRSSDGQMLCQREM